MKVMHCLKYALNGCNSIGGKFADVTQNCQSFQHISLLGFLKFLLYLMFLVQGFLTRGARNVSRGCGDAESLRLIRPTLLNTKKSYVTDFKFTSGK